MFDSLKEMDEFNEPPADFDISIFIQTLISKEFEDPLSTSINNTLDTSHEQEELNLFLLVNR